MGSSDDDGVGSTTAAAVAAARRKAAQRPKAALAPKDSRKLKQAYSRLMEKRDVYSDEIPMIGAMDTATMVVYDSDDEQDEKSLIQQKRDVVAATLAVDKFHVQADAKAKVKAERKLEGNALVAHKKRKLDQSLQKVETLLEARSKSHKKSE